MWTVEHVETMRRSVAMLPPQHPAAMDRETALAVLSALADALRERASSPRSGVDQ